MGIATGFTAARMKQIEDETITDARLEGTDLVLTTREGTDVNVGNVKGTKGDKGDTPALTDLGVTATPSELNTLDGITASVTELNYVDGVTSAIQDQINGKALTNHTHDDRYFTETEVTNLLSGKAPTSHSHAFGDLAPPTELASLVDLNDILTPGDYTQSSNAEAADGINYPVALAGLLRVRNNIGGANTMVWQEYMPYLGSSYATFWRCKYLTTWGAWRTVIAEEGQSQRHPLFRGKITGTDRNLASGTNTITSWTKQRDTSASGTAFNATTGLYTIPMTGTWAYGLNVKFATASTRRFISVEVSGNEMIREEGPATGYSALSLSTEDYFTAGQVLTPQVFGGTAVTGGIECSTSPAGFWARRVSD